jgi:hypothetical protein
MVRTLPEFTGHEFSDEGPEEIDERDIAELIGSLERRLLGVMGNAWFMILLGRMRILDSAFDFTIPETSEVRVSSRKADDERLIFKCSDGIFSIIAKSRILCSIGQDRSGR